jgi:hypothetical protein
MSREFRIRMAISPLYRKIGILVEFPRNYSYCAVTSNTILHFLWTFTEASSNQIIQIKRLVVRRCPGGTPLTASRFIPERKSDFGFEFLGIDNL